jgi:hypothetical protein
VRRSVPVLSALLIAACGAAGAPAASSAPLPAIAAPPSAAVVATADGELTFDVAELI